MTRNIAFFVVAFTILFTQFLVNVPSFAQSSPPKSIGELKEKLILEMRKQHIAGMMFTIVNRDSVLFSGGLGYADLEKKTAVTEKCLFRGASITKLFVALGVLNLIKDGKLTVDTKLKNLAPEIPFENKWETSNPVTIGELMEHTTGFSDKSPFEEYNFSGKDFKGIKALEVFEPFMKSRWKPGERHTYSGVNYAILDYIIQKVSGETTSEYLRKKVFQPLGMPYANVKLTSDGSGNYSKGYVWKEDYFHPVPHQPAFNAGYSSLNISAIDFAYALRAFLNDWKTPSGQFLSRDILQDSEIPHTYFSAKAGLQNTYAYGNEAFNLNGHIFRGHKGAIGGFLSAFLYSRKLGLGYAFAINTHNEEFYRNADHLISEFVLNHVLRPVNIATFTVNKAVAEPYPGYYRLSNPGQLFTGFLETLMNTIVVDYEGNDLSVNILGRGKMIWRATDKTGLVYKNEHSSLPQILFLKDNDNNQVITDGTLVFEKTSLFGAWAPVVLFVFSLLVMASALIFGIINLFFYFTGKVPKRQLQVRVLPLMSGIGLLIIAISLSQLFEYMKQAKSTEFLFAAWLVGKWLFALSTLLMLILLIRRWSCLKSSVLKVYLFSIIFSSLYLCMLFLLNHWY